MRLLRGSLAVFALSLTACAMVPGVNSADRKSAPQVTGTAEASPASGRQETIYEKAAANAETAAEPNSNASSRGGRTYTRDEILAAGKGFFGSASQEFAGVIERVFSQYGEPSAYIEGEEGAAAFVAGLRYGQGYLQMKTGTRSPIFWQGPSIGFDFGGNASKVFTLVYNLSTVDALYQRFPSVEGSVYVLAGFGVNYQKSGELVLAPIRTGVGVRAGASLGYLHYTPEPSYLPF